MPIGSQVKAKRKDCVIGDAFRQDEEEDVFLWL